MLDTFTRLRDLLYRTIAGTCLLGLTCGILQAATEDPYPDSLLLPDHELFVAYDDRGARGRVLTGRPKGNDLSDWSFHDGSSEDLPTGVVFAASGWLTDPEKQDVVTVSPALNTRAPTIQVFSQKKSHQLQDATVSSWVFVEDLLVADLDRVADDDGHFRDEIAVLTRVVRNGVSSQRVDVFGADLQPLTTQWIPPSQGLRGKLVAIDVDRDTVKELLVVLELGREAGQSTGVLVRAFALNDGMLEEKLQHTKLPAQSVPTDKLQDAVAFNARTSKTPHVAIGLTDESNRARIVIIPFGSDVDPSNAAVIPVSACATGTIYDMAMSAGNFVFDPMAGFDGQDAQLAVSTASTCGVDAQLFSHQSGQWRSTGAISLIHPRPDSQDSFSRVYMTAGNFTGAAGNSAALNLAISYDGHYQGLGLDILSIDRKGGMHRRLTRQIRDGRGNMALVAWDRDGDSLRLGAPIHMKLHDVVALDYVIHEPPKHVDYLDGEIINVSRRRGFNVKLRDETGRNFSSETTTRSDWTVGGSTFASASQTLGADGLIASASVKIDVSTSLKSAYSGKEKQFNSNQRTYRETSESRTESDDWIKARVRSVDVWRYRVLGTTATDASGKEVYGFFEVVLPGVDEEIRAGGLQISGYQPVHENGNLLSYSSYRGEPADLGAFTLTDGSVIRQPLIANKRFTWGGTSESISLEFASESGGSQSREYSHSLTQNSELRVGIKTETKLFVKSKTEIEGGVSFNKSSSWGSASVASTRTSEGRGISLIKPTGDASRSYSFVPTFYVANDGALKATFSVDFPTRDSSGYGFWTRHYGGKPDPALNLPQKFRNSGLDDNWVANDSPDRNRLRGFFLYEGSGNNDQVLERPPVAGDTVTMGVRVYNYSLGEAARDVHVRIEGTRYDDRTEQDVGKRQTIGTLVIKHLAPLESREVFMDWDTTGWGAQRRGESQLWRVYVTLDPDNTLDEIHESTGPGANNVGFAYVAVNSGKLTAPSDLQLRSNAVGLVGPNRKPQTSRAKAKVGERGRLRVHVDTDTPIDENPLVLVSEVTDTGNRVIALTEALGVDDDGAYVWVDWTPRQAGDHTITAKILEPDDDTSPGNAEDGLDVLVE